jgi:hypothetical protein
MNGGAYGVDKRSESVSIFAIDSNDDFQKYLQNLLTA